MISGRFFGNVNGDRLTIKQSSDFSLFQRYLDGEDITPILGQRRALGFNGLRVWLLNQSVVGFRNGGAGDAGVHPDHDPAFYAKLSDFVDLCRTSGLYLELTVFTSCGSLMPETSRQQRHLDSTAAAVRGRHSVLLELVNEGDQHDNACDPALVRPAGVIISRGSNGADSIPPGHDSPWDYELYHTNDLPEWQRKVGHNAMEWADQSGRPCMSNENTRPDRDGAVHHFEDGAEGAALLCAGACFHSQEGKFSTLFSASLPHAEAWIAGANSVPLEFQTGSYRHETSRETPEIIRSYSRTLGDGRTWYVDIRA